MKDFRTLSVLQKAHDLTVLIYKQTVSFPREELFGLTSQIRRASSSIGANIAGGCGRNTDADFSRFLHIAFGSANELDCHLMLARDLELIEKTKYEILNERLFEVKKMLGSLIRKMNSDRS
jgi:four helix bundle protein